MENERTPLRPINEINEAIREQDDQETIYTLLIKRPFVAAFAFSLFCLLVLTAQAVPQLIDYDWQNVPQIHIKSVSMEPSYSDSSLRIHVESRIDLNFSGSRGPFLEKAASMLEYTNVEFEQTQLLFNDQHLVFGQISGTHQVNLSSPTDLALEIRVHDIGNAHTLQALLQSILKGESVSIVVKGAVSASRFGVPWRITFSKQLSYDTEGPPQTGSIQKVSVSYGTKGLAFDILSTFFAQTPFRVSASLPAINWHVKLQDCQGTLHQICTGDAREIFLDLEMDNNITVQTLMTHLPTDIIAMCDETNKSPIDTVISKYLNGDHNHIYVQGSCPDNEFFGTALEHLTIDMPISGKPLDEKLIDSVQIHEVRVNTNGYFSGELTVNLHLPQMIDIDSSAVIGAQNIRGQITLSHNNTPFGKILLATWNPTVTTQVLQQYLIQVYFNQVPFDVLNARVMAIVSQQLVLTGKVPVKYDALLDVDVMSPIAQFFVTDFAIEGETVLERS